MIAYLKGLIINKNQQSIILSTGAIGYEVFLPKNKLEKIAENSHKEFFIYTKVREDEISLYGFESLIELNFFKLLLEVNGVGPKMAMEILSHDLNQTQTAILQKNSSFLSKIPGIGKKTAERIILELQNKVIPTEIAILQNTETAATEQMEEATLALINLGYNRYQINRIFQKLTDSEQLSTEDLITHFLRHN